MLHLDIQKRKEVMKASYILQQIRRTATYMKRTMKNTKVCGQLSSNDRLFYDSWFSILKKLEEANAEVVDCCGHVKTSHKEFSPAKLKN